MENLKLTAIRLDEETLSLIETAVIDWRPSVRSKRIRNILEAAVYGMSREDLVTIMKQGRYFTGTLKIVPLEHKDCPYKQAD